MELLEEVQTDLEDVVNYISKRITANEFDCLEGLKEWFENLEIRNWGDYAQFKDNTYNRVPLHVEPLFDLLLICWKPNQGSAFHPHPQHGCLVKILKGTLTEEFKKENGEVEVHEYPAGETTYICDKMGTHRVQNSSVESVISLHLYAPGDYIP